MKNLGTFRAFTLAEVLITLAIIGIIAVLTLPSLIKNYNQRILETKKAVVVQELSNAGATLMAMSMKYSMFTDTPQFKDKTFFSDYMKSTKICLDHFENCFVDSDYVDEDDEAVNIVDYLDESYQCGITKKGYVACIGNDVGIADTNGKQAPNKFGEDVFGLYFDSLGSATLAEMPSLGITGFTCPANNKLKAVKATKEVCGFGLKQAKEAVESGKIDCGDKARNTTLKGELASLGCTFKNSSSSSD